MPKGIHYLNLLGLFGGVPGLRFRKLIMENHSRQRTIYYILDFILFICNYGLVLFFAALALFLISYFTRKPGSIESKTLVFIITCTILWLPLKFAKENYEKKHPWLKKE